MKPEEKGQQLYEEMFYKIPAGRPKVMDESAKACAVICVNEVIETLRENKRTAKSDTFSIQITYWQAVRKYIQNL